MEETICWKGKS